MKFNYTPSKTNSIIEFCKLAFVDFYFDCRDKFNYIKKNFVEWVISTYEKIIHSDSWQVVGLATIVAFFSFCYVLVTQHFTIPINGDFMLQGMTFIYNGYDDWHHFFETGQFVQWDTSGMLGVSNINAYSFYYLFDPFFLALLIFPRSFLLQGQAILMMLKLILAALAFYKFLCCFHITKATRKIGAIAYAFCGWGWFYLWFFHFQEVLVFFPMMLYGIEKIINDKDGRWFILSSFLMGCTNYQFFAISLMCCFIYAFFRWVARFKQQGAKKSFESLGLGFICFVLGILMTCFIIIPNFISVQSMPRIAEASYLDSIKNATSLTDKLKLIFCWDDGYKYRHLYPIAGLIFMNSGSFSTTLFSLSGYDNTGINMYIYAPLILMLIPSLFDAIKKKNILQIVAFILMAIALETPFVYYLSGLFANAYARWTMFPIAMMVLFVCLHFDDLKKFPKWYMITSLIVVYGVFIISIMQAKNAASNLSYYNLNVFNSGLYNYFIYGQGIYYLIVGIFLMVRCKAKTFKRETLFLVVCEAIVMGFSSVNNQGFTNYENNLFGGHENTVQQTEIVEELNKYDSSFFRIMNSQMSRSQPNLAMVEGYNGVGLFCSVYNYELTKFLNWSRIEYTGSTGWTMGIHEKRMNLDEFLGVKYYIVQKDDNNVPFIGKMFTDITLDPSCPDSLKSTIENSNFKVYKNNMFIDTAFAFDSYISSSEMSSSYLGVNSNEYNYLKHAIIDEDYLKEHQDEFSQFNLGNYQSMDNVVRNYNVCVYYANWDSQEEGGGLRSLHPDYSDSYVNQKIQEYLNGNKQALDIFDRKDNGPLHYPKYTIKNYVDYTQNPNIYSEDSPEYNSKYEYDLNNGTYYGRTSYYGTTPADSYQTSLTNLTYNSKIVVSSRGGINEVLAGQNASKENPMYLSIDSKFGYNIDFALFNYDKENKEFLDEEVNPWPTYGFSKITHDQHMNNTYAKGSDWKYSRGFYTSKPVNLIVGTLKETLGNKNNPAQDTNVTLAINNLAYEYYSDFEKDVKPLLNNQVQVTYHDANNYDFVSNYISSKIVVLNIPYDLGWTITRTYKNQAGQQITENVDYFKGQGGFLSFIGLPNEVSYHLNYVTPGYNLGKYITCGGFVGFMGICYAWYFVNLDKKRFNLYFKNTHLHDL